MRSHLATRTVLLALLAAVAAGCTSKGRAPAPQQVEPGSVVTGEPVELVIRGQHFLPRVQANFAAPSRSLADESFEVRLGDHRLEAVEWVSETELRGWLPAAPAPGVYALTVVAPDGAVGTLEAAFEVKGLPAVALRFESPAQQVGAGECSAQVTVIAVDAVGQRGTLAPGTELSWTVDPSGAVTLHADAACSTPATQSAFDAASEARIHFRGTTPGGFTLSAQAALGEAAQQNAIVPGPPAQIVWAPIGSPQLTGAGIDVEARLYDALGNPVPFDGEGTLVAEPAVPLRCEQGCSAAGQPVLVGGSFTGRLAIDVPTRATRLTLHAAGVQGTSGAFDVFDPPAVALVFDTAPRVVAAGACSEPITVSLRDATGASVRARADTTVTIGQSPAGAVTLFADAACATPLTAVIPADVAALTFHARGSVARQVTLTANASGLTGATQAITIVPGALAELRWDALSGPYTQGEPFVARVVAYDAHGNVVALNGAASLWSVPAATVRCVAGCDVTGAPLFTNGVFAGSLVVDDRVASARLSISINGVTGESADITVLAPPPTTLVFETPARSPAAGACSQAITLGLRDAQGAAVPARTDTVIALSASPTGRLTYFSDAGCSTSIAGPPAIAAGAETSTFYASATVAGAVTLTVTAAGLTGATQAIVIVPGALAELRWDALAGPYTQGVAFATRVVAYDAYGNAVALGGPAALSAVPLVSVRCAEGCDLENAPLFVDGVFDGRLVVDDRAASTTLAMTAGGVTGQSAPITVLAPPPTAVVFNTPPRTIAAGDCSQAFVLGLRDETGTAVPARETTTLVLAAAPSGRVTYYADASCSAEIAGPPTIAAGAETSTFYVSATVAGAVALTVSADGLSPATQSVTVTPGLLAELRWDAIVSPRTTGDVFAAGVVALDAHGNRVAIDGAAPLSLVGTAPLTCSSGCDASGNAVFVAGRFDGLVSIGGAEDAVRLRVTLAGVTGDSNVFDVQPPPPDPPSSLAFASAPRTVRAGECSDPVVVELRSAAGEVVAAQAAVDATVSVAPADRATLFADSGCGTLLGGLRFEVGESQRSFHVRGGTPGAGTVTAEATGLTPAQQALEVLPAPVATLVWDPLPATIRRGADVEVRLRAVDSVGNTVAAFTGTADLSISPSVALLCATNCGSATTTAGFVAGEWRGVVRVGTPLGAGRVLTATSGSFTGSSTAFTVVDGGRTPPVAVIQRAPSVVRVGTPVAFDADATTDAESALSTLQVRWDPDGTGQWTAWSSTRSGTFTYSTPGLHRIHLAVRDPDGDVGHAVADVLVVDAATTICVVTETGGGDDGTTTCDTPNLSLREAIRISNATAGRQVITFAASLAVTFSAYLTVSDGVAIVGAPGGTTLTGVQWHFNAGDVLLSSMTLVSGNNNRPLGDESGGAVRFSNLTLRDWQGFTIDGGDLTVEHSRFEDCNGSCLNPDIGTGDVRVRHSAFLGGGGNALNIHDCQGGARELIGSTFRGLNKGLHVKNGCGTGAVVVVHNTFDQVGSAAYFDDGAGHVFMNNIITNASSGPISGCSASFAARGHNLIWSSDGDGCTSGDPGVILADPQFVAAGADDYRLRATSPARDSGLDLGYWLVPGADTPFLGMAPDRGGRETW